MYFDVECGGEEFGHIEIGLFRKTVPKTVKNFVSLLWQLERLVMSVLAAYEIWVATVEVAMHTAKQALKVLDHHDIHSLHGKSNCSSESVVGKQYI